MSFTRPTGPAVPSPAAFDSYYEAIGNIGEILPRMGPEHWEALEYVERYGLVPAGEALLDLEEWGLVQLQDTGEMFTTDLGDAVLEEQQP